MFDYVLIDKPYRFRFLNNHKWLNCLSLGSFFRNYIPLFTNIQTSRPHENADHNLCKSEELDDKTVEYLRMTVDCTGHRLTINWFSTAHFSYIQHLCQQAV